MIGGGLGNFAPGEWTDDTTMAWAILDVAGTGADRPAQPGRPHRDRPNFPAWYDSRIGNHTRSVLRPVTLLDLKDVTALTEAARALWSLTSE